MHIKKSLPREKFTKISNKLWTNPNLSDGAKVMYGFIASLPNGKTIHDGYLTKSLGLSDRTVNYRKKELKDAGLLLMVQLAPRVYDLYVGHPDLLADEVRLLWEKDTQMDSFGL
jgi:hypothetical protein